MRIVLEQVVQAIPQITQSLREIGLRGEYAGSAKAVRAPLSKAVLKAMCVGHEGTGLPQVQMLALALYRLSATPDNEIRTGRRRRHKSRDSRR